MTSRRVEFSTRAWLEDENGKRVQKKHLSPLFRMILRDMPNGIRLRSAADPGKAVFMACDKKLFLANRAYRLIVLRELRLSLQK